MTNLAVEVAMRCTCEMQERKHLGLLEPTPVGFDGTIKEDQIDQIRVSLPSAGYTLLAGSDFNFQFEFICCQCSLKTLPWLLNCAVDTIDVTKVLTTACPILEAAVHR